MKLQRKARPAFGRQVALGTFAVLTILSCTERSIPSSAEEALTEVVQTRQQVQQLELVQAQSADYRRAEEHYREALAQAQAGDLGEAAAQARRAVARYRTAPLAALRRGPARQALVRFSAGAALPESRRGAAEREAARLRRLLTEAGGGESEIRAVADRVLESVFQLQGYLEDQVAVDVPCPTAVRPVFFELSVSEAAPGTLLTRSQIHYVAGGEVDISVVIPPCTLVSDIFVDVTGQSHKLATDATVNDPIEGTSSNPFFYSILDRSIDAGQLSEQLRLHFPDYRDGRTLTFRLVATSATGSLTAERNLVVAAVANVRGAQILSFSEHQLRNDFVAGTYADFGDDGRKVVDGPDLIDPSYAALTLDVGSDGVHFRSKVKADLPVCDGNISTRGRFHLDRTGNQVIVVWDQGPDAGITLPIGCEVGGIILEPLRLIARIVAEKLVADRVAAQIQEEIDSLIAELGEGGVNPTPFIQRFETVEDEILVFLTIPGDNVTIEVPYGRLRLEEAVNFGLALNPNEQVLITASGLGDVCVLDGSPPPGCHRKKTGPAGLFNWTANVPVPTPWPCSSNGTCAYFQQRHQAWKRLEGFRRDESKLPFPGQNVGVLVARLASTTATSRYLLVDGACTVTATVGLNRLAFGANDYRYAGAGEFGTGTRRLSITWPPITLGGQNCTTSTFSLSSLLHEIGANSGVESARR